MKFWTTLFISLMLISIVASLTSLYYNNAASEIPLIYSNMDLNDIETALQEIELQIDNFRGTQEPTTNKTKSLETLKADLANQESKLKEANSQIQSKQQYRKYAARLTYLSVIAVFAAIYCVLRLLKEKHKLRLGKDAEMSS